MKKGILFLLLIIFGFQTIHSQEKFTEIEKLSVTAKIWGFLKYYHPQVAKGKFNWDEQFISILPKVKEAKSKEQLSTIYIDWIDSLGEVKKCKACNKPTNKEYFNKNFDLSWTQNSKYFNNEISSKLKFIEENRFQGKNYYVKSGSYGNIEVKNEPEYLDKEYPDSYHRLLSLSRYWNTVEYFFPYKYQTDQNWDEVLLEMIPRFTDADNAVEYHLVMLETVIKLDDSHAMFHTTTIHEKFYGKKYLPIIIRIIEGKVVITNFRDSSFAIKNDLQIGDVIETIDSENALERINRINKYVHGSNVSVKAKNYSYIFFNGFNDIVNMDIRRNDELITKNLERHDYSKDSFKPIEKKEEKFKLLKNNIGYINLGILEEKDIKPIMDNMISSKALIVDIRNYPKIHPYKLSSYFIKEERDFVKLIKPDLSYPGKYVWKRKGTVYPYKKEYYKGKVILLINEETQSSAEYSTMILQVGDNVITVGSQTSGADGNVSKIEFLGYKSFISGLGVFYPDGTETQRVGVIVDVKVKRTIKGIQEGKDEILEKAIEIINQ